MAAPKLMEPILYEQWQSVVLLRQCFSLNNVPPLKPLPESHRTVWRCSLDQTPHDTVSIPRSPQIPSVYLSEPCLAVTFSSIQKSERSFCSHSHMQSKNNFRGPDSVQYLVDSAQHSIRRTNPICLMATREPLYLCVSLPNQRRQIRHRIGKDEGSSDSMSVPSSAQLHNLLAKLLNSTSQFNPIPIQLQPCSVPSEIAAHSGCTDSKMMEEILSRNRTEDHLVRVCSTRTRHAKAAQQPFPHPYTDKPTPAQLSYILLKLREEVKQIDR